VALWPLYLQFTGKVNSRSTRNPAVLLGQLPLAMLPAAAATFFAMDDWPGGAAIAFVVPQDSPVARGRPPPTLRREGELETLAEPRMDRVKRRIPGWPSSQKIVALVAFPLCPLLPTPSQFFCLVPAAPNSLKRSPAGTASLAKR
jgi:hypothetical protein